MDGWITSHLISLPSCANPVCRVATDLEGSLISLTTNEIIGNPQRYSQVRMLQYKVNHQELSKNRLSSHIIDCGITYIGKQSSSCVVFYW